MNSSIRAGLASEPPPLRWLENAQGQRLAFSEYPAADPWLHLLVSHGFGEHRGWYHHLAGALRGQGISTYTFDHYHHGVSDGRRADVAQYGALTEGLRLALEKGVLPGLAPVARVGILGHSNGALAVLRSLNSLPTEAVSCVVLSNPLLRLPWPVSWWGPALAALLGRFSPALRVPFHTIPSRLTGNAEIWRDYGRDPYRFRVISVRFFKAMMSAAEAARKQANCQGLPLLLLFGERDPVVNSGATLDWFERLSTGRKHMISYPRLRHELFNEREWEVVVADMVDWLKVQLLSTGASGTEQT